MNQQLVSTNLQIAQHFTKILKDSSSVNPFAVQKLSAALLVLEREIFPDTQKKKPASTGCHPRLA